MQYSILPYGYRLIINIKKDAGIAGLIDKMIAEMNNNSSNATSLGFALFEALYSVGVGYDNTPECPIAPVITGTQADGYEIVIIPSPALVYMYEGNIRKAAAMCEEQYHILHPELIELDDEIFMDVYEELSDDGEEEPDDDYEDEEEETEEEISEHDPADLAVTFDEDIEEFDEDEDEETSESESIPDNIKHVFKLGRPAEIFKYKRRAKMFYRLGDNNYYVEFDKTPVLIPDGLKEMRIDVQYAQTISPSEL